tara:strand:- start:945 stop:1187 length:243 start_codon:yes stop_codon:yes gene_type:complete
MGKYVPEREFITGLEKELRDIIDKYNFEIHMFEQKNVKRNGQEARKLLRKLKNLLPKRIKEIIDRERKIKHHRHEDGYFH